MQLTSELLDRTPPSDLETERSVIGAIMLDPRVIEDVALLVRPEDFYAEANKKLFAHLLALHDQRRPIDVISLLSALKAGGDLEAIGGKVYLGELAQSVPYAANAAYHAKLVAGLAAKRSVILAACDMLRDAYEPGTDAEVLVGEAEQRLLALRTGNYEVDVVTARDSAVECLAELDLMVKRGCGAGLLIGIDQFDTEIGGLFPSELSILAARTSAGKTALAMQIAERIAASGRLVYLASLEMSPASLAMRSLCGMAGVDGLQLRTGRLNPDEAKRLAVAANQYAARALRIDRRPGLRVFDVFRTARRLMRDGLALVIVDYLQLLTPDNERDNRERQVAKMTFSLKAMARELKIPVLVLSQLNRQTEQQDRPGLVNLRESGAIEQDADMVLFIHRPRDGIVDRVKNSVNKLEDIRRPWPAELILEKNRSGPTATYKLDWDARYTRFTSWETQRQAF